VKNKKKLHNGLFLHSKVQMQQLSGVSAGHIFSRLEIRF